MEFLVVTLSILHQPCAICNRSAQKTAGPWRAAAVFIVVLV